MPVKPKPQKPVSTADILRPTEKPKPKPPATKPKPPAPKPVIIRPPTAARPPTADVLRPATRPQYRPGEEEDERERPSRPSQPQQQQSSTSDRLRPISRTPQSGGLSDALRVPAPIIGPRPPPTGFGRPWRREEEEEPDPFHRRPLYDVAPSNVGLTRADVDTGPAALAPGGPASSTLQSPAGVAPLAEAQGFRSFLPLGAGQWRPPTDADRASILTGAGGGGLGTPASINLQPSIGVGSAILRSMPTLLGNIGEWGPAALQSTDQALGLTDSAAWERMRYDMVQRNQDLADWKFDPAAIGGNIASGWRNASDTMGQMFAGMATGQRDVGLDEAVAANASVVGAAFNTLGATAQLSKPTALLGTGVGHVLSGIQMPTDYALTREINGVPAGAYLPAAVNETIEEFKNVYFALTTPPDQRPKQSNGWNATLERYRQATTPTAQQQTAMTAEEAARNRERAWLNWADPESVAKTYDALVDAPTKANDLKQQAQQFMQQAQTATSDEIRTRLWTQAADAWTQGYNLEHQHPIEVVNQNTNVGRQLVFELMLPDVTDLAGGLISAFGLSPAARRLSKVEGDVMVDANKAARELENLAVGPQTKLATAVQSSSYNKNLNLWTVGERRAAMDADAIVKTTASMIADVDTTADVRILLNYMVRDPAALVKGVPANLFQSPGLLARADANGLIRFGASGMTTKAFKQALNSFRTIADEFLATSSTLAKDGPINKMDFILGELAPAVEQGGYRYYKVATDLGFAPLGTKSVRARTVAGGEAVLEYLGENGKKIFTSDPMATADAARQAKDLTKGLKSGRLAQPSLLNTVGSMTRKVVSPFYIYLSPGTWMTNIVGAAATAMGDGMLAGGSVADIRRWEQKFFGGTQATRRSLEGVDTATGMASQLAGGVFGPLKQAYGKAEEFFAERVKHKAQTRAVTQLGRKVLDNVLTPILQGNGIADPGLQRTIKNRLFEVAYSGGDMLAEMNNLLGGNTRTFNLSDVNPAWLDIGHDSVADLYSVVARAQTPEELTTLATQWADAARNPWERLIQEAPPVPQRYSWMNAGASQDLADITQLGNVGIKRAGLATEEAQAFTKANADALQGIQRNLETLTQMVTDSQNPNNRYVLYNVWAQEHELTTGVRTQLAQLAEETYMRTAGLDPAQASAIWRQNYFEPARQLWDQRHGQVNALLEDATTALREGRDFTPDFSVWGLLERTAKKNDDELWNVMRLEPASGRYDARLGQVIQAGQAIVDKAVARVFAASRRFNAPSAMDEIISAERSTQMAGAQVRAYLDQVFAKDPQNYYSIRNQAWRELRQFEQTVWRVAERNIITEGLGFEARTGLKFEAFGEQLELLYPQQSQRTTKVRQKPLPGRRSVPQEINTTDDYWVVRRPDGTVTTMPANAVPDDLKQRYQGLTPETIEQAVQDEMDNLASAEPLATESQQMVDAQRPARPTEPAGPGVVGVWRTDEGDQPIKIIRQVEDNYLVQFSDGQMLELPTSELYILGGDRKLYGVNDVDAMRQAQRTLDTTNAKKLSQFEVRVRRELNLGNGANVGDLENAARTTSRNTTAAGGALPPDMALGAAHALQQIDAIRRYITANAQAILAPSGKIGEGQALRILDSFRRQVMPQWDNVRSAVAEYGDKMRSFTMLDSTNRTRLDEIAGLYMPYSFFFSRSVKNSAERMIFEPHIWRRVMQYREGMTQMREQREEPARYDGGIPVNVGDMTYYLMVAPSKYWSTFPLIVQNDYADPESASNAFSFAMESAQSMGASSYFFWDIANKQLNGRGDEISYPSYVPQGRILAWALPQMMGANVPRAVRPTFYEYNVGREVELMTTEGAVVNGKPITTEEALMAQDMLRQMKTGEQPLPEQAAQFQNARMTAILDEAAKRASNGQLVGAVSSFLTGVGVKPFNPAEQVGIEEQNQYYARKYDPNKQPYGMAYPPVSDTLRTKWGKGAIQNVEKTRPGISASKYMLDEGQQAIYDQMQQDTEAYLAANPNAQSVSQIKGPYFDQARDLETQYPSAKLLQGSGNGPPPMSPWERARWELERVMRKIPEGWTEEPKFPNKETLGREPTPAELAAYYTEKGKYDDAKFSLIEQELNTFLKPQQVGAPGGRQLQAFPEGEAGWRQELAKLVKGQYASELDRRYGLRFAGPLEHQWSDYTSLERELTAAEIAESDARLKANLKPADYALYQQYKALPAGSEERKAFAQANPIISMANKIVYSYPQVQEVEQKWGKNAWTVYSNYPKHPGDGATEEQLEKYYGQIDNYEKKYPAAAEIRLWVDGRSLPQGLPPEYYRDDFGRDYQEAIRLFGPNIFQEAANVPGYIEGNKESGRRYGAYMDAHPNVYGYWEWRKELRDMTPEEVMQVRQPAAGDAGLPYPTTYAGPRPVGSGREPIGGGEAGFPTNIWPGAAPTTNQSALDAMKWQENLLRSSKAIPVQQEITPDLATWKSGEIDRTKSQATTETPATAQAGFETKSGMTAQDYIQSNESWQKAAARKAEWGARRNTIVGEWGEDAGKIWDEYYNLPEGDARKAYRDAHPEMKVYTLAAYNPKEFAQAKEMFGADSLMAWALTPAYADTDEARQARRDYYDRNPGAFKVNAWVWGRPSGESEDTDYDFLGDAPKYSFGTDFDEAKKLFGDDIWDIVGQYKRSWGKGERRAFYNQYPQYKEWSDWWYANLPDTGASTRTGLTRQSFGWNSYGGGGGGGWGGGGGGGSGGQQYPRHIDMPYVEPRWMSGELRVDAPQPRNWRPWNVDMSWQSAGAQLKPEGMRDWRKPSW